MELKLQYPFDHDGTHYESVTLRRIKGKDMRVLGRYMDTLTKLKPGQDASEFDNETMEATLAMVASITDLPAAVVDELDAEDIAAISEKMADFFPKKADGKTRKGSKRS